MFQQVAAAAALVLPLLLAVTVSGLDPPSSCTDGPSSCLGCATITQCPDSRALVPKPECPTCCKVCAQILGEACSDLDQPCSTDLICSAGRCTELPAELRPTTPGIDLLEYYAINSSAILLVVRLPSSLRGGGHVMVSTAKQTQGPWRPAPSLRSVPRPDGSLELTAEGLEGSVHLVRVESGELRSRVVRLHLPPPQIQANAAPDREEELETYKSTTAANANATTYTCEFHGREFEEGEAYLNHECTERCECTMGKFKCEPTTPEAAAACRAAARKRGISGVEVLQVLDSDPGAVQLLWRGPSGMILQSRPSGMPGPWTRTERLTPDGQQKPVNISITSLTPYTTYEFRAVLPGAEEGRSARLEDSPPLAIGTTKPSAGQEAGFCVVLGRKIATGEEIPSPNGACGDQKCVCMPGQPPVCKPRCRLPFFRRGSAMDDELCHEKPSPEDPCCVQLICADHAAEDNGSEQRDPCEQCGDNSDCHRPMVSNGGDQEALCMCKEGFIGDAYDKKNGGCKPTVMETAETKIMDKMDRCAFKNETYMPGDSFADGCKHRCTCTPEAEILCKPRCQSVPEIIPDGCKFETDHQDECCKVVVCGNSSTLHQASEATMTTSSDAATPLSADGKLFDGCYYQNRTLKKGEKFEKGCEQLCLCEGHGDVSCKPRCPPTSAAAKATNDDKCVTLKDPQDSCCTVVLCDVTLADEVMKANVVNADNQAENDASTPEDTSSVDPRKKIIVEALEVLNATALRLVVKLPGGEEWPENQEPTVFMSRNGKDGWRKVPEMSVIPGASMALEITVGGLEPGVESKLRVEQLPMMTDVINVQLPKPPAGSTCEYKGRTYKREEEFHDGCSLYCACTKTGVQCAAIECPTDFGLDVLDPHCLDWEADPDFKPSPPRCCPDMRCRDNGTCHYRGERFDNFAEIPTKLSGCEQRCYCEFGNVTCSPACPPVPATPPSTLQCSPTEARLSHLPGEECCLYWLCPQPSQLPPQVSSTHANITAPVDKNDLDKTTTASDSNTTSKPDLTTQTIVTTEVSTPRSSNLVPISARENQTFLSGGRYGGQYGEQYGSQYGNPWDIKVPSKEVSSNHFEPTPLPPQSSGESPPGSIIVPGPISEVHSDHHPAVKEGETSLPENRPPQHSLPDPISREEGHPGPIRLDHPGPIRSDHPGPIRPDHPGPIRPDHPGPIRPDQGSVLGPVNQRPGHQGPPGPFVIEEGPFPGPVSDRRPPHHGPPNVIIRDRPPIPQGRPGQPIPGPFLVRGQPVLGPFDQHGHVIGQDGRPLIIPDQPGPVRGQRPVVGGRPLSPLEAQIEEHIRRLEQQRRPGRPGGQRPQHPNEEDEEEEVYHIRPHQGRPPPGAEIYRLPPGGEHFVLQDGSVVRVAPPQHQQPPNLAGLSNQQILTQLHHHQHQLHQQQHHPDLVTAHAHHPNSNDNSSRSSDDDSPPSSIEHARPAGFPTRHPGMGGGFPGQGSELQLQPPIAISPNAIRLVFSVPPIFVGLHGRVEVRYTSDPRNEEPQSWQKAESATDDLIESPQLVHEVSGLKPGTPYRVQVAVRLRDLDNALVSHVAAVTTPAKEISQSSTLPPIIPIDAGLAVAEVNSTWLRLAWRKFTEYEMQFIDGVQIRYKEKSVPLYSSSSLLHRLLDSYMLEDLKPNTEYEIGIIFYPFPGQPTELKAEREINARTAVDQNPYGFQLNLSVGQIKANSVELTWEGVPYPDDKLVNIYRAIYQSDVEVGKTEQSSSSTFKLAKRDAPLRTIISDLKPSTRYRIWLEAYLTNGKVKRTEVRTFTTKPGGLPQAGASERVGDEERGDYYNAMVGVSILAAMALVGLAILALMLLRRQVGVTAPITPRPAKAESAAYDNPTYKTCDDQPATNGNSKHHAPNEETA